MGNYIVESELGSGGMARIYRVRHAVLQTEHALKVLEPAYRERPELRARFLSEARIGAKLQHPHIVRVTDVLSTPEVAGIVMDLVTGPNLDAYIRSLDKPPSVATIRALFVPVLEAVAEAHRQGIVHRDLKPANILLEPEGSGFHPKVTDFGIAKVTDAARELVNKKGSTHADARMGTLAYMSPEQIRHAKEVTTRSDIFSLGATLYELATLQVAFNGDSDYEVMHQIVEGRFTPMENVRGLDPVIAAAIVKALRPDPALRFASCEEFIAALSVPASVPVSVPASVPAVATPSVTVPTPTPTVPPPPAAVPPAAASRLPMATLRSLGKQLVVVLLFAGLLWLRHQRRTGSSKPSAMPAALSPSATAAPVPRSLKDGWSGPVPFDGCLKSRVPQRIAVTCLTATRPFPDAAELRSWFAKLPPEMIDVVLLQRKNGTRLISLEIARDKSPAWWNQIVGTTTGEETCWALGKALFDRNIGRPLDQRLNDAQTAYEYDLFDVRHSGKYPVVKLVGTLAEVLTQPQLLPALQEWVYGAP
jgi:serine/threonine protein kinase